VRTLLRRAAPTILLACHLSVTRASDTSLVMQRLDRIDANRSPCWNTRREHRPPRITAGTTT
jgi:hypothetical protein